MRNKRKKHGSTSKISKLKLYERVSEFLRIGNDAVHSAQEENRKLGIPNVYGINDKIIFEMPDGSIVTESPWEKIYKERGKELF